MNPSSTFLGHYCVTGLELEICQCLIDSGLNESDQERFGNGICKVGSLEIFKPRLHAGCVRRLVAKRF